MSREQQIEETAFTDVDILANDINQHCADLAETYCGDTNCLTCLAHALTEKGYRKADDLIAEIEQLRERHAAYDRQIKADAMTEFAESLKKYYFNTLTGDCNSSLVAYHIDQILKDKLKKLEGESQ